MGLMDFGGRGLGGRAMMAELGPFGGGDRDAMFGGGSFGLKGGMRNPIFLLTSSLLTTGNGSSSLPSRSVLSSSAVQSAFQTLQTDYNNDVSVGAQPTHASVGQLQDDLQAIHKGTLTGSAATTAIQNDEAAILSSMGLSTSQVSQIQTDLQALQTAIQSGSGSSSTTATDPTATNPTTSSGTSSTDPTNPSGSLTTTSTDATTSPSSNNSPTASAVQSTFQTLQTDLKNDVPIGAQPTYASIGQVEDDLGAISKGTLSGAHAVTTVQTDTAAVWTSMGLTSSQISQIQADQAAVETAIQANSNSSTTTTSSSGSSTPSPTSIAGVEATMQSVQQYLVGLPGVGPGAMGFGGGMGSGPVMVGGPGMGGGINPGGPIMFARSGPGMATMALAGSAQGGQEGQVFVQSSNGSNTAAVAGSALGPVMAVGPGMGGGINPGGPIMFARGGPGMATTALVGSAQGGQVFVQNAKGGPVTSPTPIGGANGPMLVQGSSGSSSAAAVSASSGAPGTGGGGYGTMAAGWR
jgi:hypothetical protein